MQVRFNPKFAYYALCAANVGMRRADKALEYSNKLLELIPGVPDCFAYRASARILTGQLAEALEDCSEALKLDPKCVSALINKAEINLRLARPDDAIAELIQAESLPNLPAMITAHLHCNMALARLLLGQQAAAMEAAKSAMSADKKSYAAHFSLALCLFKEKNYDLALEHFSETINIDPYAAEAFGYRHQLYLETGKLELADADKARAAELGFEPYPGL